MMARALRRLLSIVFATWPSMHDPVNYLLNASTDIEADKLTEKWTDGKLKELEYVGLTVRMRRCSELPLFVLGLLTR